MKLASQARWAGRQEKEGEGLIRLYFIFFNIDHSGFKLVRTEAERQKRFSLGLSEEW